MSSRPSLAVGICVYCPALCSQYVIEIFLESVTSTNGQLFVAELSLCKINQQYYHTHFNGSGLLRFFSLMNVKDLAPFHQTIQQNRSSGHLQTSVREEAGPDHSKHGGHRAQVCLNSPSSQ